MSVAGDVVRCVSLCELFNIVDVNFCVKKSKMNNYINVIFLILFEKKLTNVKTTIKCYSS